MVIDEPRLPGVLMPEAYQMLTASQGGGPDNARRLGLRSDRYSHHNREETRNARHLDLSLARTRPLLSRSP